jgi:hypothetical protein
MAEWIWEPDDFMALWLSDANDRFPDMLRLRSRFAFRDDYDAHRIAVRQRYSQDELEQIQLAIDTVTNCDMRIEILGGTNRYKGSDGSQRVYRMIGARNSFHAAVLYQFTQGETDGRIRLRPCRPENLAAQLAAAVPARDPGAQQPLTVHPADLRSGRPSVTGKSPHERYRRIVEGPIDGGGSAGLLVGRMNSSPPPSNVVQWYDLPDGRYLETRAEHITVRPAAAQDLAARFDGWIQHALQRLREDEYENW